jgi:hypothetical protein
MYIGWGLMPLTGQRGDTVKPPKIILKKLLYFLGVYLQPNFGQKKCIDM